MDNQTQDNQTQNQDTEQPRADEASTEPTLAPTDAEPTAEGSTLRCDDPECVVGEDGYFNLPLAE